MFFNVTGMFKHVYWSATSDIEISEIKKQVRAKDNQFFIAEDLPRIVDGYMVKKNKIANSLEVVWISRVTPKKNLYEAINILHFVKYNINFTIYGPIHNLKYWEECQKELNNLPGNIRWEYKGIVESEKVVETLQKYHVFLFPTLGENYGHVIQEALSAGCTCIISDQTPWKDFEEQGVGHIYSINDTASFARAIERYAMMNEAQFCICACKAHNYAISNSNEKVKVTGYHKIFNIGAEV